MWHGVKSCSSYVINIKRSANLGVKLKKIFPVVRNKIDSAQVRNGGWERYEVETSGRHHYR